MDLLNQAVALAALATVAVQQVLKFNFIPVSFANRHPVPTLLVLSTAAAIFTAWKSNQIAPHSAGDWITLVATVVLIAALTYNTTLRNWTALRATEGDGTKRPV